MVLYWGDVRICVSVGRLGRICAVRNFALSKILARSAQFCADRFGESKIGLSSTLPPALGAMAILGVLLGSKLSAAEFQG